MNRLLITLISPLLVLGCAATGGNPDPTSLENLPGTNWVAPESADPAQPGARKVGLQFGAKGQVSGLPAAMVSAAGRWSTATSCVWARWAGP